MFDFINLDDIDADGAVPEYLKWQGVPEYQRAHAGTLAILESDREDYLGSEEASYLYQKLEIPSLPDDAWDPLCFQAERAESVVSYLESLTGQVLVNFTVSAVESQLAAEQQREQFKAYIEQLHQQRLASLPKKQDESRGKVNFNRQPFKWREVPSPILAGMHGRPDGTFIAESLFSSSALGLARSLVPLGDGAMLPTGTLVALICNMAKMCLPNPSMLRRNADVHLALTDVFFPEALVLNEAKEIVRKKVNPKTLIHFVAMSVLKEAGSLEAVHLIENVKLARPSDFPSLKPKVGPRGLDPNMPD